MMALPETSRLEIANDLPFSFDSLTGSSRDSAVDHQASQDDPSPSLHPHYRASQLPRDGPSLCPASVLSPSRFPPLGVLPSKLIAAASGPRNNMASHGQGATVREVPEELADASIAAAATAITLLAHYLP
jgi:hypothetical protein